MTLDLTKYSQPAATILWNGRELRLFTPTLRMVDAFDDATAPARDAETPKAALDRRVAALARLLSCNAEGQVVTPDELRELPPAALGEITGLYVRLLRGLEADPN